MSSRISSHFSAIVPCGVADPRYGVTSLVDLGLPVTMADVDVALRQAFGEVFGAGARRRLPEATTAEASRRRALRRHLELAGDVAPLLGQAAEAVGIALDLVDMQIGLIVQRPEQFAHAR